MSTINGTVSKGIMLGTVTQDGTYAPPLTITSAGYINNPATNGNGVYGPNTQGWIVLNYGRIHAIANSFTAGAGVYFAAGGQPDTVVNSGTIVGGTGVSLQSGGNVTNRAGGTIVGFLAGGSAVSAANAPLTLVNAGTIGSTRSSNGILMTSGGDVVNQSGASIVAYRAAIYARTGGAYISNAGYLKSTGFADAGIYLGMGTIVNQAGGSIYGQGAGILLNVTSSGGTAGTIINAGSITANERPFTTGGTPFAAVVTVGGVSATNLAGGVITDYFGVGIEMFSSPGIVTNAGTIVGAYAGVSLAAGGTVVDSGTISALGGTAIAFGGSAANRLVLEHGYSLGGVVTVTGTAANTLELLGTAGDVTVNLDSHGFANFNALVFGADSAFSETLVIPGTTGTIANTISGFVANTDIIDLAQIGTDGQIIDIDTVNHRMTVAGSLGVVTLQFDALAETGAFITESDGSSGTNLTGAPPMPNFTWISNTGNGDWGDAANWSPTGIPGAADNATIGVAGTIGVTVSTPEAVSMLVLADPNATLSLNSSLALGVALDVEAASVHLNNSGTIVGGTIVGGGLVFARGTLSGVAYDGTLDLSATGAKLHVSNGITLNGTGGTGPGNLLLTGYQSALYFTGSETLDNATLSIGGRYSYDSITQTGTGTLILGSNLTVAQTGTFGGLYVAGGGQIINVGLINIGVNNGRFLIDGTGAFINSNTIGIASGNLLTVNPGVTFANQGTIGLGSGSKLHLRDSLTTHALGSVTNTGGTLFIDGTLDNTGAVLASGMGGLGTVALSGTIVGGTITGSAVQFLSPAVVTTLSGVAYDGTIDLSGKYAGFKATNGITLAGADGTGPATILLTGYGSGISFTGTETLDNAVVSIGGISAFKPPSLRVFNYPEAGTLTLGAHLTINQVGAYAQLYIGGNGAIINDGTINANGSFAAYSTGGTGIFINQGALNVTDSGTFLAGHTLTFTNSGTISLTNGGILSLNGSLSAADLGAVLNRSGIVAINGTFNNTANTLVTGTGANLGEVDLASAGTLLRGTVTGGGLTLRGGILSGVTSFGPLDLSVSGARGTISNGITLTGTNGNGPGSVLLTGASSALYFVGTQTIDNATIQMGASSGAPVIAPRYGTAALTLGSHLRIEQTGRYAMIGGFGGGPIINDGTLEAAATKGQLDLQNSYFTNNGIINVTNGDLLSTGVQTGFFRLPTTISGTGTIALSTAGIVSLTGPVMAGQSVDFLDGTGQLNLAFPVSNPFAGTIGGFQRGDDIDLTSFVAVTETFANNALVLSDSANEQVMLQFQSGYAASNFTVSSDGQNTYITFAVPPPMPSPSLLSDFSWAQGWGSPDSPRLLADIDQNGTADYVGFGAASVLVGYGGTFGMPGLTGPGFSNVVTAVQDFGAAEGYTAGMQRGATPTGAGIGDTLYGQGFAGIYWYAATGSTPQTDASGKTYDVLQYQGSPGFYGNFGSQQGWTEANGFQIVKASGSDAAASILGFGADGVLVGPQGFSPGASAASAYLIPFAAGNNSGWSQQTDIRSFTDQNGTPIDLNHDGITDFVGMGPQGLVFAYGTTLGGTYSLGTLQTAQISGSNSNLGQSQGWTNATTVRDIVADPKTGFDDIIAFGASGVEVAMGQDPATHGSQPFGQLYLAMPDFGSNQGWSVAQTPRLAGDVNGDGTPDLIGFGTNSTFAAIGFRDAGNNLHFAIDSSQTINDFGSAEGWSGADPQTVRTLGDVAGSGHADLVLSGAQNTQLWQYS